LSLQQGNENFYTVLLTADFMVRWVKFDIEHPSDGWGLAKSFHNEITDRNIRDKLSRLRSELIGH